MGIWPDVTGEVLLDALPLASWDRTELGPYLGYLPQDMEMFEGTIAENIARLGEVDSDKVIAAARSAGLHEMILRFPKGYDTPMGEAGSLLSGGQRQRVGLARALYGRPALIVLDEPNANLDDVGERALAQAVRELKVRGATVFLITHRPNAIGLADRWTYSGAGPAGCRAGPPQRASTTAPGGLGGTAGRCCRRIPARRRMNGADF
jgi:ATP-binding cassette subfamily C exporter for protease/lipase